MEHCCSVPFLSGKKTTYGSTQHDLQLIDEIVDLTAAAIETREEDFKKIVGL